MIFTLNESLIIRENEFETSAIKIILSCNKIHWKHMIITMREKKNHVWRQFIPKELIRERVQVKTLLVLLKVSIQNVMPSITTNLWLTKRKFTKLLRNCFKYCFNPAHKILYSLVFWRKIDFIWGVFVLVFVFFSVLKHVPDILGTSLLSINCLKPVYMETFKLCSCMVTKSLLISSYFFKG